MKFVIAPDSFKNCLAASAVADALAEGIQSVCPESECVELPMADGGEGTVAAVAAATGGMLEKSTVSDPLGRLVPAEFIRLPDGTVVMEVAAAAGLELLSETELNPLITSTFGVGELIRHILRSDCRRLVVGLGGSATVDGGIGMLQALGVRFYDRHGVELPAGVGGGRLSEVAKVDRSRFIPALAGVELIVASDVTNPLLGTNGAAAVFAPQKGGTPAMVEQLEQGLANWAHIWNCDGSFEGGGAAGGLGFTFCRVLSGRICSGAELLLSLADFDRIASGADWVITGEGRSDGQSLKGKLCSVVARRAKGAGVPTILVSGALGRDFRDPDHLFAAAFSIATGPGPFAEALTQTRENLVRMGRNLAGIIARPQSLRPGDGDQRTASLV